MGLTPPLRLVLVAVIMAAAGVAVTDANKFTIKWYPEGNYTEWQKQNNNSVHVGDWLVFQYTKDQADVIQVNESSFNKCDATGPISNYSKGRSYAVQLNESGHYYFICSKGFCYNGMKLDVTVHPLPPPSPPPLPSRSMNVSLGVGRGRPAFGSLVAAGVGAALAVVLLLMA